MSAQKVKHGIALKWINRTAYRVALLLKKIKQVGFALSNNHRDFVSNFFNSEEFRTLYKKY